MLESITALSVDEYILHALKKQSFFFEFVVCVNVVKGVKVEYFYQVAMLK